MATSSKSTGKAAGLVIENALLLVDLKHTRDTKGTHVFVNDSDGAQITNIYFKKGSLGETPPEKVQIVVSAV